MLLAVATVFALVFFGPSAERGTAFWAVAAIAVSFSFLNGAAFYRFGRTLKSTGDSRSDWLDKIRSRLSESTRELSGTVIELDRSGSNLSRGSGEQLEAVQFTLKAMDGMAEAVESSASHVQGSIALANRIGTRVSDGHMIIEQTTRSMKGIESANVLLRDIVKLVSEIEKKTLVIDEIMVQTKLLSFNAQVEAARAAGEHGRGFAVVAAAMRDLAALCTQSAEEIRSLVVGGKAQAEKIVSDIGNAIEESQTVNGKAVTVFNEITGEIGSISSRLASIDEVTRRQELSLIHCSEALARVYATTSLSWKISDKSGVGRDRIRVQNDALKSLENDIPALLKGEAANR
jgi:methyl-accepting chemotaxis protein